MTQTIDDILSDFELFEDWDERYRYLIDLGRRLEPLPEAAKTEANKVRGCASQVWLAQPRTLLASVFAASGKGSSLRPRSMR